MSSRKLYTILPFQLGRFDDQEYLIVNESGEYHFIDRSDLVLLIEGTLLPESPHFNKLQSKQFIVTGDLPGTLDMVATKYRTRKNFAAGFTGLHMMVLTVRCNQDCKYCQVSAESDDAYQFDMSPEVAEKTVEMIFMSPNPLIKIEFQGGEPTLNWKALTAAVKKAEKLNVKAKKRLQFVICTNLTNMNTNKLEYLRDHKICISTSLDGPRHLHDKNRILRKDDGGTYDTFIARLDDARRLCGNESVSALMTTTIDNVDNMREVVDEYIKLGFRGMFLRSLNPYGLASKNAPTLSYSMAYFARKFEETLDYIIELNLKGTDFNEFFTTLLLSRILTPFSTGFVDLQSPSGAGISGAIYDYNGDVYPADEARMLARMGDQRFKMGNIFDDNYSDIFGGPVIYEIVNKSIVEVMPGCASCVFRTYCGADPIRSYLETGDVMGKRPGSSFCEKNMAIMMIIFRKLRQADENVMDVFWSWVTSRPLKEIRYENL